MKICSKCHLPKSLDQFGPKLDRKSGIASQCRPCERLRQEKYHRESPEKSAAKSKRYRDAHPEKVSLWWHAKNLRRYGLTVEQYNAMVLAQAGVCLICMKPPRSGKRLSVDHDHATGEVRGLLCHVCNQGLGYFYDDPELLRLAAAYLLRHCPVVEV